MSITDELREWFKDRLFMGNGYAELTAIADRIDAEALSRRNEAYNMGYNAGIDMGFSSTDDWLADHEDAMAEHGWVKLPVDADGEVIHIGDVMDGVNKYDPLKEVTGEVITIHFDAIGESKFEATVGLRVWSKYGKSYHTSYIDPYASTYRHHHEPTVEDVLREFAEKMAENTAMYVAESWDADERDEADAAAIAEFASRLRLAGDAE